MLACRYSHVLKTDDDCYVRVSKLVNLVRKLEREGEGMMYVGRQVVAAAVCALSWRKTC